MNSVEVMEGRTLFLLQNADLYKHHIWIMKWCGYARIWETKENEHSSRKALNFVVKCWNNCLLFGKVTALFTVVIRLIYKGRNGTIQDVVGGTMFLFGQSVIVFTSFWFHKKAKTIKALMFLQEIEYSERKKEYRFVKAVSFSLLLCISLITTAIGLTTLMQFFQDEFVQYFYDSLFPSFHFRVAYCPAIFRMGAVFCVVQLFLQKIALQNAVGVIVMMFPFSKRHFDLILSSETYQRTEDLKKTGKLISDIERSVQNLNDIASLPILITAAFGMLEFCVSVVNFLSGIEIQPGFEFWNILLITSECAIGDMLGGVTVLYNDRKGDHHLRRIYRTSAQRMPRDTDYAIHAESLVKQIQSTNLLPKLWKFYKVDRQSLLNIYTTSCSYIILVVQMMPGAVENLLRREE